MKAQDEITKGVWMEARSGSLGREAHEEAWRRAGAVVSSHLDIF